MSLVIPGRAHAIDGRAPELASLDAARQSQLLDARYIMRFLGVLESVGGVIICVVGFATHGRDSATARVIGPLVLALGIVFLGLSFWARKRPFAASVVGLVFVLAIIGACAAHDPSSLSRGNGLKFTVLVALGAAVYEGYKHRQLQSALRARGAWPNHLPFT